MTIYTMYFAKQYSVSGNNFKKLYCIITIIIILFNHCFNLAKGNKIILIKKFVRKTYNSRNQYSPEKDRLDTL